MAGAEGADRAAGLQSGKSHATHVSQLIGIREVPTDVVPV